jgi:hypothetical protein
VLKDGQIVERGNHIELIQRDGFYRELYELQRQVRDEAGPDPQTVRQEGQSIRSRVGDG